MNKNKEDEYRFLKGLIRSTPYIQECSNDVEQVTMEEVGSVKEEIRPVVT